MKKLNFLPGFLLLISIILVSSSFTSPFYYNKGTTLNNGVGNVVTIDNGQTWVWIADNCNAPWVLSTDSRVQTATNGFFHVTSTFQLPPGHCDIPSSGAIVKQYSPESWAIINSNGKVIAKIVYNPNGN